MSSTTPHTTTALCRACAVEEDDVETIAEAGEYRLCDACSAPLRDLADVEVAAHFNLALALGTPAEGAARLAWQAALAALGAEI